MPNKKTFCRNYYKVRKDHSSFQRVFEANANVNDQGLAVGTACNSICENVIPLADSIPKTNDHGEYEKKELDEDVQENEELQENLEAQTREVNEIPSSEDIRIETISHDEFKMLFKTKGINFFFFVISFVKN